VFAVEGGSERHYAQGEVHNDDRPARVILANTFAGRDVCWSFARRLAERAGV
jgi:hypothetical protein